MYKHILKINSDDIKEDPIKILAKYDVPFYFWSTVSHFCQEDGDLGDAERAYIEENASKYGVTQNKMDKVLEGVDYTNTFKESLEDYYKERLKTAGKEKIDSLLNKSNWILVFFCIITSTQDGLVRDEMNAAFKLAKKLDVPKKDVKEMVDLLRAEQEIADTMLDWMVYTDDPDD